MNEKLTEQIYSIRLVREWSGSGLTVEVKGVGPAQAQRRATEQYPGWKVVGFKG